ncbi:MAG: metalloregulator ArsR/SmtB family transcription factor [Capsulimonas sp.]|uniref:ArsR/SmtB family transcription factor n=1 Tax=Capsulimonas sp. TaxID=2494211 RepID=UPI003267DC63
MEVETLERASALFAALGHPTRLRIAEFLCEGPKSVNEVAAALDLAQSGTSQHLAILARAGVVKVEAHRSSRIYSVRGPRIGKILVLIEEFCSVHNLKGATDIEEDGSERFTAPETVTQ